MVARYRKALSACVLIVLSSVLLFDVGCYFILPEDFSGRIFLGYRVGLLPDGTLGRGYPHNYYESHPERGFDIGFSKPQRDHFLFNYPVNYSYPIWSNSLGCFDTEHSHLTRYIYLAGDSTTWGYTRFAKKFGTLLEERLHLPVLKCGVTHTGQLHQLSKMKEVVSRIGEPPAVILVVWSPNDIINDALYPHSTVIDGWQVDTTYLSSTGEIVRESSDALAERIRSKVAASRSWLRRPTWFLVKYSATYNVLIRALYSTRFGRWLADDMYEDPDRISIYSLQRYPPTTPALSYVRDDVARKNREAFLQFQAYADSVHAKLIVALLSLQPNHNAEVRSFLQEHAIRYLDLGISSFNFNDKNLTWRIDPHASEQGNEAIAEALYRFMEIDLREESTAGASPTN